MSKFNYQLATVEQITLHLATVTRQALSLVRKYYKDDEVVLTKINQAAEVAYRNAKIVRLQAIVDSLKSRA